MKKLLKNYINKKNTMFHIKHDDSDAFLKKAKLKQSTARLFLIIGFIIIIFVSSFSAILYNENFYTREYKKNKIYDKYGEEFITKVTNNILAFFKNKEDIGQGIDEEVREKYEEGFFNYNEKSHMYDVKKVIKNTFLIYYIAIAIVVFCFFLLYFNSFDVLKDIGSVFVFTGCITIFLSVVLYFSDFSALFDLFHSIIFSGNYTFPTTSNLIQMFPLVFFGDFAYRVFFFSFVKSLMFIISGMILLFAPSLSKK